MNSETVEKIKKLMGEPRNYGPTPEEQEEIKRKEEEERLKREEEERLERERKEAEEAAERRRRQEEWVSVGNPNVSLSMLMACRVFDSDAAT